MKPIIEKSARSGSSLLLSSLTQIDYLDAYTCRFQTATFITAKSMTLSFFSSTGIVSVLMKLRDFLIKPFAIRPHGKQRLAKMPESEIAVGRGWGLFRIIAMTPAEILMGENDTHLNFRVSLQLEPTVAANEYDLTLSTVVKFNNRFGKLYFLFIRPFHSIIVRAMIKKMIKQTIQINHINQ